MKLNKFCLAAAISFAAASIAQAEDPKGSVSFYNWGDYIAEDTISSFTEETGIKVQSDYFDSINTLETKLLTGGSSYDLVVTDASRRIKRQINAGALQTLNKDLLPNYKNIDPQVLSWINNFDEGNAYAVPYMWGTTGLGYNVAAIKERLPNQNLNSWDLLLNPETVSKLADCGVSVLDDPEELYVATMLYLGKDPKDTSKASIKLVEEHLKKIRPYIRYFDNNKFLSDLAENEICLAVSYNGLVFAAQDRADEANTGAELAYIIPEEGATLWFDAIAIPAGAKNTQNAHALLNHLMDAETIAGVSNFIRFANGYSASEEFIDPELLSNKGIYPTEEVRSRLVPMPNFPNKFDRNLSRMWARVKTAK